MGYEGGLATSLHSFFLLGCTRSAGLALHPTKLKPRGKHSIQSARAHVFFTGAWLSSPYVQYVNILYLKRFELF